jgi:hypothetical protein
MAAQAFLKWLVRGALWALLGLLPTLSLAAVPPGGSEEKIIFVRHGEKPAQGLGQLNCQGLNRALSLPAALLAKFGKPDFVFASDPHDKKADGDQAYNYVRPLLTVAPTAVQFGLPINTSFGYEDIQGLQRELAQPRYHQAVVLVGWEHRLLEQLVKAMLAVNDASMGSKSVVPHWKGNDFDSIYVVTVRRNGQDASARFTLEHEQLDGQSLVCPVAAPKPVVR